MSSYDDPTPGHREAVSQLAETRSTVRRKLVEINASGGLYAGPHPNLVPATTDTGEPNVPTDRTIATAARQRMFPQCMFVICGICFWISQSRSGQIWCVIVLY